VENYNFEIRKRLLDYDDVMNKQREVIYKRRNEIIEAIDLNEVLDTIIDDYLETMMQQFIDPSELPEHWPVSEMLAELETMFLYSFPVPEGDIEMLTIGDLQDHVTQKAHDALRARVSFLTEELGSEDVIQEFEKYVMLQTIDEKWMDHLHELDYLKEGIHFRAYAQKDPLVEYKKEAFALFGDLNATIDKDALFAFFHARISVGAQRKRDLSQAEAVHSESGAYRGKPAGKGSTEATDSALKEPSPSRPVTRQVEKVGRNDPCPCGSGKKYKKCCGATG
jgi:preprotein translocase subunit SecA